MKHTLYISDFNYSLQDRDLCSMETFENFLLFDCISFYVVGINSPLLFLIGELGLNKVEELLARKSLEFVTKIPLIAANLGEEINGHYNYKGVPPLFPATFTNPSNADPEYQIDETLKLIPNLNRDRKRIFKNIALKQYKIPQQKYSYESEELIIGAYKNNKLSSLGLEYNAEPEDLNIQNRKLLAELSFSIIETGILSEFRYKSKNNNKVLEITKDSFDKIFNALQVSKNNAEILKIENIPDLKNIYKLKKYKLSDAFSIRDSKDAKKYREWINEKTDELGDLNFTKAYIDDISRDSGFFSTHKGKLLKTISLFTLSSYIGVQLESLPGIIAGLGAGKIFNKASDLGIDLIDEYILDGLLKGWNPRFFIDELRQQIK